MIFWALYFPTIALVLILYFYRIDHIFKGKKAIYKIDEKNKNIATGREVINTFVNFIVFVFFGALTDYIITNDFSKVYFSLDTSIFEVLYLFASFFIALALHDIYFYASHRLLHTKFMFKYVHSWHHRSHNTNAWSSFSFHPIEGVFQILIVPLVAIVIPIHEIVLMFFSFVLFLLSVYGHCGYELRHNKFKALNIFNTSLHHYQHHKYVRYNFGIYLNFWDKLFKTDYPDYEKSFQALKEKINSKIDLDDSNLDK